MHESSLARKVLRAVVDRAALEGATRVTEVRGWIADAEALSPESLAFHFAAHARGTPAEGARLALRLIHLEASCSACGRRFAPEQHVLLCPACGSTDATLLGREGLGVDEIDVE